MTCLSQLHTRKFTHRGRCPPPPPPPPPPPFCFFIALFSSLPTCCRYVATPGLASSARNKLTVRCLKPNGLGTRPRSSIPLRVRVRTYYIRERNLTKEEAHGGPGTSRRALRKIAKNPTCSTWDDFTCPIPRVVRGTILRQQLHVQYVGRFYVRPNDVKSPSVSWASISYVAGFYVD